MIIVPKIDSVGYVAICSDEHEVCISAASVVAFKNFIKQYYDVKKHDAACMLQSKFSTQRIFFMSIEDIPMHNVYCPKTGKPLLVYESLETKKALIRINNA